jgi:hypothetical protein
VFEQLVAQAAPFNLLTIHEEAAVSDPSALQMEAVIRQILKLSTKVVSG